MIYLFRNAKDSFTRFVVLGLFFFVLGAIGSWTFRGFMFIISGSFLEIVVFGLGLIYKVRKGYEERLSFELEANINSKKALRAQINPHFIFNALSSIQSLILNKKNSTALKYLSKFSRLTRNILESSIETNVVLHEEIKMLEDYLELESLRFNSAFEYDILIGENADIHSVEIPFMILQPFVENAIIHGLLPKKEGEKRLLISFRKENDHIICEIDDNGVGRRVNTLRDKLENPKKTSRGLEITKQRLESIQLTKKPLEIVDKIDANQHSLGTKVILKIPVL